ncbi:alkaline phosphatase D family protein [Nocardia inohanensis]|uniref:alkaline phosphatase D family protein n=1 Tax=Nocardia inohanensis TaxID=209246 RepID=UPI00082BAB9F|nr:alkaline phosphatase D family protein [Nocardia inohanensis]
MSGSVSRRALLGGSAAALLAGVAAARPAHASGPMLRRARDAQPGLVRDPHFANGVTAGVPRTDGITLWTRVTAEPAAVTPLREPALLVPNGPAAGDIGDLAVIVSRRADLSDPEVVTTVAVDPGADGTARLEVSGLRPGEEYFYQFRGAGAESPTGRFRTLRPADSREPVRIGWFACQDFASGYYGAHRLLGDEELDLVVCLGDYVYENSYPAGPRGTDLNLYPQTLDRMREKYRVHRSDPDLHYMHSRHAFVPIWDDHEFRNNYWSGGWTPGPLAEVDRLLSDFQQKKQWAWQSWFEYMPVPRFSEDPLRTHRTLRLGRTVELFAPDVRRFRDVQGCGDSMRPVVCADADDPARSMLGRAQADWLIDGISESSAQWRVLANANMMMGMVVADDGSRAWLDTWDGYGAERARVLSAAAQRGPNLVVVTGDDHDAYAGELWDTGFAPGVTSGAQANTPGARRAGVEFVVPSLTSPGTGHHDEEALRKGHNPHLRYANMATHGYGVLEAGADEARFHFREVPIETPEPRTTSTVSFRVPSGTPALEPC